MMIAPTRPEDTHKMWFRLLDIGGLARSKAFLAVILPISLLMVLLEAKYNIDLLTTISNPNASQEVVSDLSQRGKLLASFGITWAVARVLLTAIRPFFFGLSLFITLAFGTYHTLDYIYTEVIADLKPEIKVKGFGLFSYRQDLLTEKLFDPDIPLPKDNPVIGKIFMGAFPIVLLDDRYMLPVQDTIKIKANYKAKEVLRKADIQWPHYERQMLTLQNAHEKFVDDSRKAVDTSAMEREWQRYATKMDGIRSNYNRYIEGSRKAARYGSTGERKFREQSGGLSPNTNLSLSQFLNMLRDSNHAEGRRLRQEESRELGQRANGKRVYVRDMPYFMGHSDFLSWTIQLATESFTAKGLSPNPNISPNGFVAMLRNTKLPEGEQIRKAEKEVLAVRPNGTKVLMGDLPYFLSHEDYLEWFSSQAEEAKNSVLPTVDNVDKFSNIQEVNSAIFLPPMAIITSLTSAMTNGISLVIICLGFALTATPITKWMGSKLIQFASPLMVVMFVAILYFMPSHVFSEQTSIYDLETQLHHEVGMAGQVWSKLSNLQKLFLR